MAVESPGNIEQPIRDRLALERTILANERTLLAYSRTAIMLVATGGTLLKFYIDQFLPAISGGVLIAAGIGVAAFGVARFRKLARSLPEITNWQR
jgi:putative membrane protein